jgi:hypothetical protein
MLGNPFIKPWSDLAELADEFGMQEFVFGSWYVCWGTKPERVQAGEALEQLMAAE